ncbi:penicillin-binding protein 2 [candidate division WWE3 bacterium]|uniref:Penicillin-binding protein 2 n=1 Tax=candidate division WWE3 bacterium TaxID=2053526 RepID=A0A7X9HGK8_UNCKA|nr:penicillin-binding protein 2 [candidate division WWE3 bacterium]
MNTPNNKKFEYRGVTRIRILRYIFLFSFVAIVAKLFYIQVLSHDKYQSLAYSQYVDTQTIPPRRGNITTSDGFLLAGTKTNYTLYAEPKKIPEIPEFSEKIAKLFVELDQKETSETTKSNSNFGDFYLKVSQSIKPDLFWVGLRRGLSPEDRKLILDMNIPGIGFEEDPVRYYPEDTLAAHVLGFVGSNEKGERTGYYGIEGGLNNDLKGKQGRIFQEVDSIGRPILLGNFKKLPPIQGRDIVLTIDRSAQYLVEQKLKEGVEKYNATSGTVVVMNPSTGEIIAMANYPTFDYKNLIFEEEVLTEEQKKVSGRKKYEYRNFAISSPYEPGSVIKPFTISAAIDLGIVNPNTTFEDNGPVWYSGKKIDNWDGKHYQTQTITQLLQKSNNIGAAWVGHQVGSKNVSKYFESFGIGAKYGIELEGEETGTLRDHDTWTDIDLANVSFGQGMSATPLQVLNGFNVFANGGYLLQPKIVSRIIDNGKVINIPTKNIRKVLSSETTATMVDLLEKAAEGGEAKFFIKKEYRIAGKTGTAQIYTESGYDPNKSNATFVGFMSGSKKFSMIVKLEEPRTSIYAAETAVPLWMTIADDLVKYYGLAPDKPVAEVAPL